ncbi:MAG: hypothetical protein Q9157_003946 [Trypethelium eluteriae]
MSGNSSNEIIIAPLELILSCSICQATINDVYSSRPSNHGLNDGRQSHDTTTTKLWLTECAHLTCGEHLEGGGAPFHPESKPPRAPCPFCAATKNDQSPRNLYGIRGISNGDFDAAIPPSFFQVPPIKLDADFKDTGAMRFQYLSLMRYGMKALHKVREQSKNSSVLEKRVTEEATRADDLEGQVQELQARVQVLGESEKRLQLWKRKEPQIKHYLGLVTKLANENELLRKQLLYLGYEVPSTKFSYRPPNERVEDKVVTSPNRQHSASRPGINGELDITPIEKLDEYRDHRREPGDQSTSNHTTFRPQSKHAYVTEYLISDDGWGSSGTKRKRADYLQDIQSSFIEARNPAKGTSRDMMPPPSALPIRSPQRLSHRSSHSRSSPRLTLPTKPQSSEQTIERPDAEAVQVNRYERQQNEANGISREHMTHEYNNHTFRNLERVHQHGTAVSQTTSPQDYKRARLQDPENNALLGDPSFVPPKPIQSLEPSDAHHSANVIHGSRHYNYEKSSQYNQGHRPQSPKRIDAFFGMEDVVRNIYRPSPEGAPFVPRSAHRTEPLTHYTGSNANRRQVGHLKDARSDEHMDTSNPFRSNRETHSLWWSSPYQNQNAAPVTPAPVRQRYDSATSPYKSVSSPFFHSLRANLYADTPSIPRSKNEEFRDMMQGFRTEPAQQPRTDARIRTYTDDPYDVYRDPFYRGRGPRAAANNSLIVPETPRTAEGLFQRPDLPRAGPVHSTQTSRNDMYGRWAQTSAPKRAAPLPSATPSTSGLLGPRSSFGSRRQDTFGIRGARSGALRTQSFGGPSDSRPPMYGQGPRCHDSEDRVGSSTVGVMRGIRR